MLKDLLGDGGMTQLFGPFSSCPIHRSNRAAGWFHQVCWLNQPIGSMVLVYIYVYMLRFGVYGWYINVTIYSSTMDPSWVWFLCVRPNNQPLLGMVFRNIFKTAMVMLHDTANRHAAPGRKGCLARDGHSSHQAFRLLWDRPRDLDLGLETLVVM